MSVLGEDGCDNLLQAASEELERCNILKHLNCAGKEKTGLSPSEKIFLLTVPRRYFFCGTFMLILSWFVMLLCASVYCCFVATCWEKADILALVCDVYL